MTWRDDACVYPKNNEGEKYGNEPESDIILAGVFVLGVGYLKCSDVVSGQCGIDVADCHCEGQSPRIFISGGERDNENGGEPLAALVYKAANGVPDKILFQGECLHSLARLRLVLACMIRSLASMILICLAK